MLTEQQISFIEKLILKKGNLRLIKKKIFKTSFLKRRIFKTKFLHFSELAKMLATANLFANCELAKLLAN